MNTEFDCEPFYGDNDKCVSTKIKSCGDKVNTNFQGKKILKNNASCKCLSFIMLDSVIGVNKKYDPQTRLEECKYETKKTKMENLINDDLESSLPDMTWNMIMNLIMNLILDLTVNLIINLLMNLTIKSAF